MRTKSLRSLKKRSSFNPKCIIDVGANVGQSAVEFRAEYPDAFIHAVEPIKQSFEKLRENVGADPLVKLHNIGLSNNPSTMNMLSVSTNTGNRIPLKQDVEGPLEAVDFITGDILCERESISNVDFLKIDAEGHDLSVIAGFCGMLNGGRVQFVQVECGLSPDNFAHVPYEIIAHTLFAFNFRLWGLFGLSRVMRRYKMRSEGAYFGDAVFVYDGTTS